MDYILTMDYYKRTFQSAEKLYRMKTPFLDRALISNHPYDYKVLSARSPYDIQVSIIDPIATQIESDLKSRLAEYTELVQSAEKMEASDLLKVDANLFYLGMPVMVKHPSVQKEDNADIGGVHRAQIMKINGPLVTLLVVDEGYIITLPKDNLLPITVDLARLPKVAIPCRLAQIRPEGGSNWSQDRDYKKDFTGVSSRKALFMDYYPDSVTYEVVLEVDEVNVAIKYFHAGFASPVPLELEYHQEGAVAGAYPVTNFSAWVGLKVIAFGLKVFFDNVLGRYRCILHLEPEAITNLLERISAHVQNCDLSEPFPKSVGSPCLAMFGNEYFRATILSQEPGDNYKVNFVDYGDISVVHASQMLKIPPEFLQQAEGAISCQITDMLATPEVEYLDDLKAIFEEKDLYAVIDACDDALFGKDLLVSLFQPEESFTGPDQPFSTVLGIKRRPSVVREILHNFSQLSSEQAELFLQNQVPPPNKFFPGSMVSVINSWESIWLQLEDAIDKAGLLSMEMWQFYANGGCSKEDQERFWEEKATIGGFVACRQMDDDPADKLLYRGKVIKEKDGGKVLEVHYVDYGNSGEVNKMEAYPLHEYFLREPLLAFELAIK